MGRINIIEEDSSMPAKDPEQSRKQLSDESGYYGEDELPEEDSIEIIYDKNAVINNNKQPNQGMSSSNVLHSTTTPHHHNLRCSTVQGRHFRYISITGSSRKFDYLYLIL